jgi:hypothetical protein
MTPPMTPNASELSMRELLAKCTPGPWMPMNETGDVWCADHPVAETVRGEWGDSFPSLRVVGGHEIGSVSARAVEAYMQTIAYGNVPEGQSLANAELIARLNPATVKVVLEALEGAVSNIEGIMVGDDLPSIVVRDRINNAIALLNHPATRKEGENK